MIAKFVMNKDMQHKLGFIDHAESIEYASQSIAIMWQNILLGNQDSGKIRWQNILLGYPDSDTIMWQNILSGSHDSGTIMWQNIL